MSADENELTQQLVTSLVQKCIGLTLALTMLYPLSCFITKFFFCHAFMLFNFRIKVPHLELWGTFRAPRSAWVLIKYTHTEIILLTV